MKFRRRRASLKMKLSIAFFSLLFFLFLLEIGMRVTGLMLSRGEFHVNLSMEDMDSGTKRILCLGDSFTYGGLVERNETYPTYLGELLANAPPEEINSIFGPGPGDSGKGDVKRVQVYNGGVCESTTAEMLNRLQGVLDKYQPDMAIMLIGSANKFNTQEYSARSNPHWFLIALNKLLELRVAKMLHMIYLNVVTSRNVADGPDPFAIFGEVTWDPIHDESRWVRHKGYLDARPGNTAESIEKTEQALSDADPHTSMDPDRVLALAHFYFETERMEALEALLLKQSETLQHATRYGDALAYYTREHADRKRKSFRFDDAAEYYLKAVAYEPEEHYNYYWLIKVCDLQSRVTSEMVHAAFDRILTERPDLAGQEKYAEYRKTFKEKTAWEAELNRWTAEELEEAIQLCKERNIRVVLQNYPISYPMANGVLASLSRKHNLPFVDNLHAFTNLEPKEKYLLDDSHCSPEGHRVMATNVYEVLTGKP